MPDESIHQPHDKLFKQGFGDPVTAAAFLKLQFPPAISQHIDWENLELQPGSFVDSHYRQHESDLLFLAPWQERDCLLYLLFEHQTTEDPHIALRLLRYMVRIWEASLKSRPGQALPVILPVVLAQNDSIWNLSPTFSALLDLPFDLTEDLRPFLPDFSFRFIQLAELPFDAICGTPQGILVLRVMKAERSDALLSDPVWDEALLSQIPGAFFELLLRYILDADVDRDSFKRRIKSFTKPDLQESAMTLAQQLRQEGRQEGLLEGLLELLEIRFGEIPDGVREALAAVSDLDRLRALHRAAIRATTLNEFSEAL